MKHFKARVPQQMGKAFIARHLHCVSYGSYSCVGALYHNFLNDNQAQAKITLFEKMQGKNKIYTIELESLESTPLSTQAKSAEVAVKAQSAAATPTEAAPIAKTDGESIAQDLQTAPKVDSMLKSAQKAQGKPKEMQQLQSTIQTHLEKLPPSPTPQPINEAKIKALIKRFDNIENLQEHLSTRADTKARQEIFSLLDDTLQTPQVHYKKDGKDKYLKRYKSERKEPYFYLLVTKDGDKTFITHFKTRDSRYLSKEIAKAQEIMQGADIIEALSQRTGDI